MKLSFWCNSLRLDKLASSVDEVAISECGSYLWNLKLSLTDPLTGVLCGCKEQQLQMKFVRLSTSSPPVSQNFPNIFLQTWIWSLRWAVSVNFLIKLQYCINSQFTLLISAKAKMWHILYIFWRLCIVGFWTMDMPPSTDFACNMDFSIGWWYECFSGLLQQDRCEKISCLQNLWQQVSSLLSTDKLHQLESHCHLSLSCKPDLGKGEVL